ncbi:2815_t:CDS:1, partial [Rhizophagus irregularis]
GKSYPAKWERIVIEDEDVYSFKDNLEILVQSQLEVQVIFQEYYITSYNMKKKGD